MEPDEDDYTPLEQREFVVRAADSPGLDMETAQRMLDREMEALGYVRISGGHEDEPGVFGAWGWKDLDGDGEIG